MNQVVDQYNNPQRLVFDDYPGEHVETRAATTGESDGDKLQAKPIIKFNR